MESHSSNAGLSEGSPNSNDGYDGLKLNLIPSMGAENMNDHELEAWADDLDLLEY